MVTIQITPNLKPLSKPPTLHVPSVDITWSKAGWEDRTATDYVPPLGADILPGNNFSEKLSGLLNSYFLALQTFIDSSFEGTTSDAAIRKAGSITSSYLKGAEDFARASIHENLNAHQLIHIHELTNNFLRTVIHFFDAVCDFPNQLEQVTRPNSHRLDLHPELCGLLLCRHILETDPYANKSGHQKERIPYAPSRVDPDITYEEIANLYRTSRVNLRRVVMDKIRPKLRMRMKNLRGDMHTQ